MSELPCDSRSAPATRYDLRFSALGVPVRVHPLFWLASIVFGIQLPPRLVVIWVGVVFVSILIHELGHAMTIRAFGWYPLILLYTFGGLAIYQPTHRDPRKELLISLAGPAAGLLFVRSLCWYSARRITKSTLNSVARSVCNGRSPLESRMYISATASISCCK